MQLVQRVPAGQCGFCYSPTFRVIVILESMWFLIAGISYRYEPYPQLRRNAKMAKSVGPFVQRAIGKKPKADRRTTREVRKCVPLLSKIVNKPHQSFLMFSSRGTSRNVIPSIQSIPLGPHTFRHFCVIFAL